MLAYLMACLETQNPKIVLRGTASTQSRASFEESPRQELQKNVCTAAMRAESALIMTAHGRKHSEHPLIEMEMDSFRFFFFSLSKIAYEQPATVIQGGLEISSTYSSNLMLPRQS